MKINDRKGEYLNYLNNHILGVQKAYEMIKPIIQSLPNADIVTTQLSLNIRHHDMSKWTTEEFVPYLNHFYPIEGTVYCKEDYDAAWNHHQKRNPHHWQYWILIKDEGDTYPLDMSIEAIIEMLCDWHSFSLRNPESTAYDWYQKNKFKMILSEKTRATVEQLIIHFKEPLKKD